MTDTSPANAINDVLRKIPAMFDRAAYFLLGFMYQIFFNVASADLFNNATILGFFKRVQLIIGVFMVFELAITIMKGIVNPDTFMDSKSGIGSIITRVIFALILLTILVPISIPSAQTEYERQLNNNGLLFGTLYSLQTRLLNNNTLGRLILGTTDGATSSSSNSDSGLTGADKQAESLKKSANIFSSTILKGFYRINLIPEDYRDESKRKKNQSDEMVNEYRMCKDIDEPVLNLYTKVDAEPSEIIDLITWDCTPDTDEKWLKSDLEKTKQSFVAKLFGKKRYAFAHIPFVSAIVGFVFVVILLDFTIQIAIRAVKLAVLRLIAPIPIISYMDPKGGKDGAFNSWVKTLTSTYLDLFLRLAIIYFVIYLIQDMIVNGIVMNTGSGMVGILSAIIIWIGLFIFARQAPKFIRQVLGMKDEGGKFFAGFGALSESATAYKNAASKVAGVGAAAVGAVGSYRASKTASEAADEVNGADDNLLNRGKHILAGITGGVAGFGTGAKAAVTSKDHGFRNSLEAMQKRNATEITRGSAGSTTGGRIKSTWQQLSAGETEGSRMKREIEKLEEQQKVASSVVSRIDSEADKQDDTRASVFKGSSIYTNYKDFNARFLAAKTSGKDEVEYKAYTKDANGNYVDAGTKRMSMVEAERNINWIRKDNQNDFAARVIAGDLSDDEMPTLMNDLRAKVDPSVAGQLVDRDSIKQFITDTNNDLVDKKRENEKNVKNDLFSGNKS